MKYRIVKKKIDYSCLLKLWVNSYINWLVAESKNIDENAIKICINYEKWEWNLITKLGNKINLRNKDIKKYALYHFYKYLI